MRARRVNIGKSYLNVLLLIIVYIMSIKSGSRLSATQRSPSIVLRSPRNLSTTQTGGSSVVSLLWGNRVSAAFRVGKGGFKVPRYQNTYRLAANNKFNHEVVEKILEQIMNDTLTGIGYNAELCMKLCQDMSQQVRSRIYKKDFDRYKYIVTFTIIEKTGQTVKLGMGRLWDVERDTYCTHIFENTQFIAIGTVYGIYYE